jgi:hypothetical protein
MAEKENRLLEQQGRRPKPGPYITKKKKPGLGSLSKKKKDNFIIMLDDKYISDPNKFGMDEIVIINPEKKAKGGRVGLKSGSKGCKLAMKGKGRAYGKNS